MVWRPGQYTNQAIAINIKDEADLIDWISNNEIAYDEVKMVFNNKTITKVNIIVLTGPTK